MFCEIKCKQKCSEGTSDIRSRMIFMHSTTLSGFPPIRTTVSRLRTTFLEKLDCCLSVLSKFFDFSTFDSNNSSCQTLMNQQSQLAVKVASFIVLVLWRELQNFSSKSKIPQYTLICYKHTNILLQ